MLLGPNMLSDSKLSIKLYSFSHRDKHLNDKKLTPLLFGPVLIPLVGYITCLFFLFGGYNFLIVA